MKIEDEYNNEYGSISRSMYERIQSMLGNTKLTPKKFEELILNIARIKNIKWNALDFTIYLVPKATPRPRNNRKTGVFYVSGAADNKRFFKKFKKEYLSDEKLITTPCIFQCTSYLPIPRSMPVVEQILAELGYVRPTSKPDWDNVGKTYSDMIQDTLLFDDNLIIEGISRKYYSLKPRIEIHIEYMNEFDSKYNYNKIRKKVQI